MGPHRDARATRPYPSNADFRSITQPYTSRRTAVSAPTTAITPTADALKPSLYAAAKSLPVGAVAA